MFLNFKFLTVKFLCFCYPYSHRLLHFLLKMVFFFYWKPLSIELIILHVVSYSDAGFLLFLYIFVVRNTNLKIYFCALKEILWNLLIWISVGKIFLFVVKIFINVSQCQSINNRLLSNKFFRIFASFIHILCLLEYKLIFFLIWRTKNFECIFHS